MAAVAEPIEKFHLGFLTVLRARFDQRRYILKGGVNLRYFFGSDRLSEDIDFDLDLAGMESWRFVERIDGILASDALARLLSSLSIQIAPDGVTKTKQTDTTRRWRVFFTASGRADAIRTKIEFSARNGETRFETASIPDEVVAPYAMRPPSVQHYLLEAAVEQKVAALALRPETQARDVFDLDLLLRRRAALTPNAASDGRRVDAAQAASELTFGDFET